MLFGALVPLSLGTTAAEQEAAPGQETSPEGNAPTAVYVVPNFHPASCGWLTNFSKERVYCANSYLDHLDRIATDDAYAFVISEANTMLAIGNFTPERFDELKQRIKEGRVEAVNAFLLEPTVCLSGGEALVKQGIEGLRWQEAMLGARPRHCWMIDVTGFHEQMPQIAAGLGLDTLVHCRMNNFGSTLYWGQSPDGTRILTISPGHYNQWSTLFRSEEALSDEELEKYVDEARSPERPTSLAEVKTMRTPEGAPMLVLAGSGDYSLAPLYQSYPKEFLAQWNEAAPDAPLRFTTFGAYVDAIRPGIDSGAITLPTFTAGWNFTYYGFWIQNPTVKQRFRRAEHALQAAEMLSTIASLAGDGLYPAQDLYHAWLLMMLNMDRNTLWGAAGGMVFEHPQSWDVKDRFDWVDKACERASVQAIRGSGGTGDRVVLFNPANWIRTDPFVLPPDVAAGLADVPCQVLPEGGVLCVPQQPSVGFTAYDKGEGEAAPSEVSGLPSAIETSFYTARIDATTGALASLKLKASGKELLAGPANVLVAETPAFPPDHGYKPGNHMDFRPERTRKDTSNDHACEVKVLKGPLATIVEVQGAFCGGKQARRVMTFYHHHPRIDFDTWLEDIPNGAVVVAEFPLAPAIREVRRGIPYGFAHGGWPEATDELKGYVQGITPAVRWSHYTLDGGGGVALLDRGLSGREIDGNTPLIFLLSTSQHYMGYPTPWLSGEGKRRLQYSLLAHEGDWEDARIPQMAWEYNCPPVVVERVDAEGSRSFVQTSDNIIVQALRREEDYIEIRLAECLGQEGEAMLEVNLPHVSAALTDLLGRRPQPLSGGPAYRFPVRPQQIVTVRLETKTRLDAVETLTDWTPLVPEHKRPALREYDADVKGHPPHG